MTIVAKSNIAGSYGVPGVGVFQPYEARPVPNAIAAGLARRPEFSLSVTDPDNDLVYRDPDGRVRYVGYTGPVDSRFGYGGGGITILRALTALGVQAKVNPGYNNGHEVAYTVDLPKDAAAQLRPAQFLPRVELMHCLPPDWARTKTFGYRVGWTMYETSRLPAAGHFLGNWTPLINSFADHVVVPCQHNKEMFAQCGVDRPITVLPYGLDTDIWPYTERPERETFTIVQYGDLTSRKGVDALMEAFQLAFPQQGDVRLVLKTQGPTLKPFIAAVPAFRNDRRIHVIDQTYTRNQLVQLLFEADCFAWLSRGEGFGLPPLQAALTGLPVVMTTHTGMGEYYRPNFFYGVQCSTMSQSPLGGEWFEPDVEHAAAQLRKVYDDRKAARKRAKGAATFVRNNFSLDKFAERLGTFLDTL